MKKLFLLSSLTLLFFSCSDDNDDNAPTTSNLEINIDGLEDLGADYVYEGWIIVDGAPVSTGTFTVDENNTLSKSSFTLDKDMLESATKFVLSIEPNPDPSPMPADTKLFVGDFNGNTASLTTGTVASSFDAISGEYIIAAPTGTGAPEEQYSGVWFLNNSSGSPVAGLDLPTLEAGWKYEGWVVVNGVPLSTGTFTSVTGNDEGSPFSGANPGPPFPGEDFLENAPSGVNFPIDVRGKTTVISIEPYPDNNAKPFVLKPLASMVAEDAMGVQTIGSNVSASFPKGSVSR